jgi:hypothetical protein
MTPNVYNIPPAAMNVKIEPESDAIALSYAITPLHPIAIYKTTERRSKRPGKSSLRTIPTAAADHRATNKDAARPKSLSCVMNGV